MNSKIIEISELTSDMPKYILTNFLLVNVNGIITKTIRGLGGSILLTQNNVVLLFKKNDVVFIWGKRKIDSLIR